MGADDPREARPWIAPSVAFGLFLLIYGFSAARFVVGADNGEFATLSVSPGVAHPPGYPLYTLYLRAMAWLPGISPAHTSALATAVLGAATVATLVAALRRWSLPTAAALGGAAIVGLDVQVWNLHTHAEVFALNNLIAAGILWAAAPDGARRGISRAATLGLLAGLGLANHHTIVMIAPVGIYGIWRASREAGGGARDALATLGAGIVMGLVGLLPYLYLTLTTTACELCLQWGEPDDLQSLWAMFTRSDYGTTNLGIGGERLPLENFVAFGRHLAVGTAGAALLLAVLGTVRWRRLGLDKLGGLAVLASFLLAGPVFTMLFNIAPEGIGAEIVARFYALPLILLAPLVGAGLCFGARTATLAGALAVVVGLASAPRVVGVHTDAIESYTHDLIAPLPPDAIVLGTGDHRMFGVHYQQLANGLRPDVTYIDAKILAHSWYEQRIERRLGIELPSASATEIPIMQHIAALAASGRPLFVTHLFFEELRQIPTYPFGVALRVVHQAAPPSPRELAAINADLFAEFQMQQGPAAVETAWEREVFEHYERTWDSLAGALAAMGDEEGAARARTFATLFETGDDP